MLTKRDGSPYWYIRFEINGRQVFESSGTVDRKAAQKLEQKRRTELWNVEKLGAVTTGTWAQGVEAWLTRKAHKRSLRRDRQIFDIAGTVWRSKRLDEIDKDEIRKYTETLLATTTPANANRHLSHIRAFLNKMVEWNYLDVAPRVPLVDAPDYEPTIITRDQFAQVFKELPPHVKPMAVFGVETGLRWNNVARLRWKAQETGGRFEPYVEMDGSAVHVPASSAKAKKPIHIPLSSLAWDTIRDMERSKSGYVFTDHRGHGPVSSISTAWGNARKRAGLPGLRFHDLRHAWASWHLQSGTPERVVQELGAWATRDMVTRYGHLNVDHLREYVK